MKMMILMAVALNQSLVATIREVVPVMQNVLKVWLVFYVTKSHSFQEGQNAAGLKMMITPSQLIVSLLVKDLAIMIGSALEP